MKVVVTGAGGQLGRELVTGLAAPPSAAAEPRAAAHPAAAHPAAGRWEVIGLTRSDLDVSDRDAVLAAIGALEPDAVVHAAAWTAVDACEADPERAWRVNALGTRHVAEGAARVRAHLCYVSTDYVFDGVFEGPPRPYTEWDPTAPLSVYGRSKLAGEAECRPGSTVVRTAWLCGAHGRNFVSTVLRLAREGSPLRFVDDQRGCPTFTGPLVRAIRQLVLERRPGLYHVTCQGDATWYELARAILAGTGRDPDAVEPVTTASLRPARAAARPAYSVLDNLALRGSGLPQLGHWTDSLNALLRQMQ